MPQRRMLEDKNDQPSVHIPPCSNLTLDLAPIAQHRQHLAVAPEFQSDEGGRPGQQRPIPDCHNREKDHQARGKRSCPQRKRYPKDGRRSEVNGCRQRGQGRGCAQFEAQRPPAQRRVNIKVPFVPPKPNEFDRAVRISILRAVFGT